MARVVFATLDFGRTRVLRRVSSRATSHVRSHTLYRLIDSRTRYDGSSLLPPPTEDRAESSTDDDDERQPGVSVLRPLRGLDTNLYDNLESSFLQVYPKFEIIFSVAEEGDAAIPIVHELMQKYPHVTARLIIGG